MRRPFNEKAHEVFDLKNKQELVTMMTRKGYSLVGDLSENFSKLYDIKFIKDGKEIAFENETRTNFNAIRDRYNTIHVPNRKKDTQADYYVVWNVECDEFFLIANETIQKHKGSSVNVLCDEFARDYQTLDVFLDIPKEEAELFKKIKNKWRKIN